jgi:tRNA(fMet)-specific endonuclease VapC
MAVHLLDKGIFLAFLSGNPLIQENVKAKLGECYLPAIVAAELYENQLEFPASVQNYVEQLIEKFSIIVFNEAAALKYATIQKQLKQKSKAASIVDVIIAATALARNAIVITHRIEEFKIIAPNLQLENWKNSPILSVTENQPGALYKVANFFKKLGINILADYYDGIENRQENTLVNVTIDLPLNEVEQKIRPKIDDSNVKFETNPDFPNATKLIFTCQSSTIDQIDNNNYKTIKIEGRDQVGLLADIAKLIFDKNINICKSYSSVNQQNNSFFMVFAMLEERNNIDWDTLKMEVENIEELQACYIKYK